MTEGFPEIIVVSRRVYHVCAFIHAWVDDFTYPMPLGKDPPCHIERYTDMHASYISRTQYFPTHPPLPRITLFSSYSSWTRYVCEGIKCDDGMFPNTALWVGTQIHGFDYMDAFTPHLRFLPAITVSFGTKSLLLWNSEHSDTKEKWLFGWISSSRKLQRPSFNR